MFTISPWVSHRDARTWENPDDPSLDRSCGDKQACMPFGVGPRTCIGMNVAMVELQLIALQVASSLDLEVVDIPQGARPIPSVALLAPPFSLRVASKTDAAFRRFVA